MSDRPQAQVRRQWRLLTVLAGVRYGCTLAHLAEVLGVCPRTVRRDLDVLADAGFPIERNHEGEGIAIRFVWGAWLSADVARLLAAVPPPPGRAAPAEAIPDGVRTTKGGLELDT